MSVIETVLSLKKEGTNKNHNPLIVIHRRYGTLNDFKTGSRDHLHIGVPLGSESLDFSDVNIYTVRV